MKTCRKIIAGIDCVITEPDKATFATQTIVCLHGIGGDDASFAPQSEELSENYRVVAWNMPGYGQSVPASPLTFEVLSDRLQQAIAALDVGPVHLMGQSIGGMVAQEVYFRYPQSVRSLILVATTSAFGGKDDSFKNAFLNARLKPLDSGMTMPQVASAAIPSIVGSNTQAQVIASAVDSMATLDADVYRDILRCLVTFDRRSEWEAIKCPVCLVAGSEDTNAPAATMQKMADKLPHSVFYQIPDAGHLVNLEKGAVFNELVHAFLKRLS